MSAQLAFDLPVTDLDKARAQRRANVSRSIRQRLICDTPAARNTDPESSHVAAGVVKANGSRATLQHRVLDVVQRLEGLTVVEIAVQLGLHSHTVGRRLSDLAMAGGIRRGEQRYVDGLPYTTWWPASEASWPTIAEDE